MSATLAEYALQEMSEIAAAGDLPSPTQTAFDLVTENLMKLGTLTIDNFLSPPYLDPPPPEANPTLSYVARPLASRDADEAKAKSHQSAPIFLIHHVCSQTFGSIEALKYEIIDDAGKECA